MKLYCLTLMNALLMTVPAAAQGCQGDGHHHGGHDCADCGHGGYSQQSSARMESLQGTILEIHRPAAVTGVVEAWLKTPGSTVLVRLGPSDFLRQKGLTLNEGGPIAVKGYRAASSDEDMVIVTELESGGKTLLLRNERGRPLW
jgi:hypothetical protein